MSMFSPQDPKLPFKITKERLTLLGGGTLVGILAIVFGFKLATPLVKKACQSILESSDTAERAARVASVEAVVLKPGKISKRITTIGKLRANESVTLRAEMQGRIKEIAFKEGSMVKKGDLLIRFDDDEAKAQVDKSEADIEFRQARFNRMQLLQSKGLTKGPEFDQERGGLNMAKAELEVAKARLSKTMIIAPFEGKIGLIDVSVGAFVDSQKELVTLVDFDPMKIEFKIPEKFIQEIGAGQTAEVRLDTFPDKVFHATVEAIDSRVDPQTHSIAVRATIPNGDGTLQSGLFGSVSVIIGMKNDALLVPESALGREGDIEYVWVVTNGKAGRKRVLTGTKESGKAEITAGLRPDEIVITSGQLKLGEGMAVKISNMNSDDLEVAEDEEGKEKADAKPKQKEEEKQEAKESTAKTEEPAQTEKPEAAKKEPEKKPEDVKPEASKPEASKPEATKPEAEKPEEKASEKNASPENAKPAEGAAPQTESTPDTAPKAATATTPSAPETETKATDKADESKASESKEAAPATPPEPTINVPDTAPALVTEPNASDSKAPEATPKADQALNPSQPEAPKNDAKVEAQIDAQSTPQIETLQTPDATTVDTQGPNLNKVSIKLKDEKIDNTNQNQVEKSFFAKSWDYVTNLFKRN